MNSRTLTNGLFTACLLALTLVFSVQIFSPDAGAKIWSRAQNFENNGQIQLALQHYRLLAQSQPDSLYAPRALLRLGDLLAAQGRSKSDSQLLREAIAAYEKLATDYPSDPLANEALLDAGQISAENLKDGAAARRFYGSILKNNRDSSEVAGKATLRLGELALSEGEKSRDLARGLLQRVLQKWPKNAEIASQAQFQLGVLYETLFKNRDWAQRAYDAVIQNFPQSKWANDARQRLGLMVFSDAKNRRPVRRVMLDISPLPDEGFLEGDSLWKTLRPLLAARGLETDDVTLRGWSLEPFFAAVDMKNPANAARANFDAFENVVANAGLKFTVKGGGKSAQALDDLQDDLDSALPTLVYFRGQNGPQWALCIGYDSQRGELFLQTSGARYETIAAASFAKAWEEPGPFGKPFTLLSFWTSGQKSRPKPSLTPLPTATPKPGETPAPSLENTPAFVWELPALSRKNTHERTLRRAALLLNRGAGENLAPNIAGLSFLSRELEKTVRNRPRTQRQRRLEPTQTPATAPEPTPETQPETADSLFQNTQFPGEIPVEEPTPAPPENSETATPTPTTAPQIETPSAASSGSASSGSALLSPTRLKNAERARVLLGFFGDASRNWINKRRIAAHYLRVAARQTGNSRLNQAADALERSAQALETAGALALDLKDASGELAPWQTTNLREITALVETARDAESLAARRME